MVSHFRSLHGWYARLHSHNRFMHGSNCTWARSGETEFAISRVTTSLYFEFEPKANRNKVFHRNFEYSPKSVLFFFLPASGKPDARLRRRRYDVEAKLELSRPQTNGPLSSSLLTSTQIHADSSSTAHSGRPSRPELGCSCFPKPHASFFPIPASGARSSADHARPATWQLVVLVPRSTETHVAKPMAISRNAWMYNLTSNRQKHLISMLCLITTLSTVMHHVEKKMNMMS